MRVFIQAKKPDSSTSATLSHRPVQSAGKRAEHEDRNLDAQTQPENQAHFGHNFSRISLFPPTEASGESIAAPHSSRSVDNSEPGHTGHQLPNPFRQRMESSFRQDFSSVRIHEGPQAPSIGAVAYTRGTDIHFAPGTYQPESVIGQAMLGHELTHVVQQRTGQVPFVPTNALHINDDPALESEADTLGAQAAQGHQVHVGNTPAAAAGDPLSAPDSIQMLKLGDLLKWLKKLGRRTEQQPSEFKPIGLPPLFTAFEQSFPKAAELLFDNPPAFELIFETQRAGAEFGGYSDVVPQGETRSADKRAYTIGNKVYLPKSQKDRVIYLSDFLFELNNAIRKPQYEELETQARNGTIQKPDFIRGVAELELQGAFKLGAIWSEVKQTQGSKLKNADQYDNEFYLADYQSIESGMDRNDLIDDIIKRTYGNGAFNGKTFEQRYGDLFDSL
jgi:hypothetical protein